jgi:hypothetical protein
MFDRGVFVLDSGAHKGMRRFFAPLLRFLRVRPDYRPLDDGNASLEHSRLETNASRLLIPGFCGHGIARLSSVGSISRSACGVTSPTVDIAPGDPMIG